MNKKIFNIVILFIIISFFKILKADCGSFRIEQDYFAENLVGFYINSIDINTGSSDVQYFRYRIINEGYDPSAPPISLKAEYEFTIYAPNHQEFNHTQTMIKGTVNIEDMIVPELVFSNVDLNYTSDGVPGADFKLEGSVGDHIELGDDKLLKLQQIILESGKLPNGRYVFSIKLKCFEDGTLYDEYIEEINNWEPLNLELITPGGSISDTTATATLSTYPIFMWNIHTGGGALGSCDNCDYGIRVSEYDPFNHSSLIDAIEDASVLPSDQSLEFKDLEENTSTFSYSEGDGFELIPGHLYAWQINTTYESTRGNEEQKSDIFVFKVLSIDDLIDDSSNDQYSELLQELLGYKYEELFGDEGELKGFSIKNNTIILNNQVVPISTLDAIIQKLNSGDINIIEIEVE